MIKFYFPENQIPFHFFEALQIFGTACGLPSFCAEADSYRLELLNEKGDAVKSDFITAEIATRDAGVHAEGVSEANLLKRYLYKLMSEYTGYSSPWGCMTGVRPTKIVNVLKKHGMDNRAIFNHFKEFYLMSDDKANLAIETADVQIPFLEEQLLHPENAGFYIGIPFCPTRCLYCSFTSNSIVKYKKSLDLYLDLLEREIKESLQIARQAGYKIESVYLGGGTPTSFDETRFERFMKIVTDNIDFSNVKEFALEAGRPDSITKGKLLVAKNAGVNRISVNPQTMNDFTLRRIGRLHTANQTEEAFYLAREAGFENINMDIIAGLPDENTDDFMRTLARIEEFSPDSLTVHTLSIKRAADLRLDEENRNLLHGDEVGVMVSAARDTATKLGMHPFYMYRQKNMMGNHENVCYCRPGCESPYNIHIMEEEQTIIATGAAGVSKRVSAGGDKIERAFNVKGIEDYMARLDLMIERKRELFLNDKF